MCFDRIAVRYVALIFVLSSSVLIGLWSPGAADDGAAGAPGQPKRGWGPEQAEGPPNTNQAGDLSTAWASLTPDGQPEWLLCRFPRAVETKAILIHETYNPGAVDRVTAFDPKGREVEIWSGFDPTPRDAAKGVSVIPIAAVNFTINTIRVHIDSPAVPGWNEIDAVGLLDSMGNTHWAQSVAASSSFAVPPAAGRPLSPGQLRNWGPEQAAGPPNTEHAGDIPTAWASRTQDGHPEWIVCRYAVPVVPKWVVVYETFNPGAVVKVTAFDPQDREVEVWRGSDPTPSGIPSGVSIIPVRVPFRTAKIRVHVDSPAVPGWNEIDAVGLREESGETHWAQQVDASSTFAELVETAP